MESIDESGKKRPALRVLWNFHHACNYRCEYCVRKDDDLARCPVPAEQLAAVWRRMHERYGTCWIDFTGGEPSTFPGFEPLVLELARDHAIHLITNLSLPLEAWERLARGTAKNRFVVSASFHPTQAELEPFLEKCDLLHRHERLRFVNFVAWPPLLEKLGFFRKRFLERGLPFYALAFMGQHGGKQYPDAYTPEERSLINDSGRSLVEIEARRKAYQLGEVSPKGKLCRAGSQYIHVDQGKITRCSRLQGESLGDLYSGEFDLLKEAAPCPADYCQCEFEWLKEFESY